MQNGYLCVVEECHLLPSWWYWESQSPIYDVDLETTDGRTIAGHSPVPSYVPPQYTLVSVFPMFRDMAVPI